MWFLEVNKSIYIVYIDSTSAIRLCLRLPNGKKETISMSATDTIEVNTMNLLILMYLGMINENTH